MGKKLKTISPYVFPGIKNVMDKYMAEIHKKRNQATKMKQEEILKIVMDEFGVTLDDIVSECRKWNIVNARYVYFAAVKLKLDNSLKTIGDSINRDHTTVIHGLSKFKDRYDTEQPFKESAHRVFEQMDIKYSGHKLTKSKSI